MHVSSPAGHEIKANVRDEAPENYLGDRNGQGDEDYSEKRRQTLFDPAEVDLPDAFEHRHADEYQYGRSRIRRHHSRQRREKETRQKTKRGEDRRQPAVPARTDARDALDIRGSRRTAR